MRISSHRSSHTARPSPRPPAPPLLGLAAGLLALLPAAEPTARTDRIILRNLESISDRRVVAFDEDGVRLDDDRVITWDRIERGRVAADRQQAFDRMLEELGAPLYRIRQRLQTADYRGLAAHAEALYPQYVDRSSPTAYMVIQATMWARLAAHRREQAVEPFLRCFRYLKASEQTAASVDLPGSRRLQVDMETALSAELVPVWFDEDAAREALPAVTAVINQMKQPRPAGTRAYYATLALSGGQPEQARRAIADLSPAEPVYQLVRAQDLFLTGKPAECVDLLDERWQELPTDWQPMALYWLGRARLHGDDPSVRQLGMLDLLRIPAVYGGRHRELSAAALYETMQALAGAREMTGSIAVRRELLDRYGQTWHAAYLRQENNSAEDEP